MPSLEELWAQGTPIEGGISQEGWNRGEPVPTEDLKRKSILSDTKNKIVGGIEGLLQTATGALATPVAGIAGLIRSAGGLYPYAGAQTVDDVQNALTYKPMYQPDYAQQFTNTVNAPLRAIEWMGNYAGDKIYDWTGQPELAAGVKAGTMLAAPVGVFKGAKAIKSGAQTLAGKAAPALYESSLKIPPSVESDIRTRAVQTGLDEGYPVSRGGLKRVRKDIDALNEEIKNTVDGMTGEISMEDVVRRVEGLKAFYDNLPPKVAEKFTAPLTELQNEYASGGIITPQAAQKMKQTIYTLNRKHFGELQGAIIEGNKAVARGLKEEIVQNNPKLADLNAADSLAIELEDFLERAVNRMGNYEIIRIADVGMTVAGGGRVGILNHYINNPWFKSKLAIILNKASKRSAKSGPNYTRNPDWKELPPEEQRSDIGYVEGEGGEWSVPVGSPYGAPNVPAVIPQQPQFVPDFNTMGTLYGGNVPAVPQGRALVPTGIKGRVEGLPVTQERLSITGRRIKPAQGLRGYLYKGVSD